MWYLLLGLVIGIVIGALYNHPIVRGLIHLDKEVNEEVLNGRDGETISTRAGRIMKALRKGIKAKGWWKWCILCKLLDIFDKDHCIKDYEKVYGKDGERDPYPILPAT